LKYSWLNAELKFLQDGVFFMFSQLICNIVLAERYIIIRHPVCMRLHIVIVSYIIVNYNNITNYII